MTLVILHDVLCGMSNSIIQNQNMVCRISGKWKCILNKQCNIYSFCNNDYFFCFSVCCPNPEAVLFTIHGTERGISVENLNVISLLMFYCGFR